jgi:hypothetical protein
VVEVLYRIKIIFKKEKEKEVVYRLEKEKLKKSLSFPCIYTEPQNKINVLFSYLA